MRHTNPSPSREGVSLSVKDLWVRRGRKSILKGITLDVPSGKLVAVIGPNGSGKTTLLKAITGERPYAGDVLIDEESLYASPEYWLRRIGYVPADNVLHDYLTVHQALTYAGLLRRSDISKNELDAKVDKLLRDFNISDELRERFIKKGDLRGDLSSGERKKINICAELLTGPPVLLLDEPCSDLDPHAERDLMDRLEKLAQDQIVLIVMHKLNTIEWCDWVVFLANGQVAAQGEPSGILEELERKAGRRASSEDLFLRWAYIYEVFDTNNGEADDKIHSKAKAKLPHAVPPVSGTKRKAPSSSLDHQISVLACRYFHVRSNDWKTLLITLAAGLIGGFLLFVLPPQAFVPPGSPGEALSQTATTRTAISMLSVCVTMIGMFAGFLEISKEKHIYQHERLKGLSPVAYLLSKWIWLAGAVGVIAPLALLSMMGVPLARNLTLLIALALALVGVSASLVEAVQIILSCVCHKLATSNVWRERCSWLSNRITLALALGGVSTDVVEEATKAISRRALHKLATSNVWQRWCSRLFVRLATAALVLAAGLLQVQKQPLPTQPISERWVEILVIVTLTLACVTAISLGLAMSAIAGDDNKAVGFMMIMAVFQILLSGQLQNPAFEVPINILSNFAITHWTMTGLSSSLGLYCWRGRALFEDFNSAGHLISVWLSLVIYTLLSCAVAIVTLQLRDTWATRPARLRALISPNAGKAAFICVLVFLFNWMLFLRQQSIGYAELTFYDSEFGSMRFARVDNLVGINPLQFGVGVVSQSFCGAPVETLPPSIASVPVTITMSVVTPPPGVSQSTTPTIMQGDVTTATLLPTETPTSPSASATATIPPKLFPDLPDGTIEIDTHLFFQPEGEAILQAIPAGATFAIRGRNKSSTWYRVLWSNTIGWVRADAVVEQVRQARESFAPPPCARPLASINCLETLWTSNVNGQIGIVIDLYRSGYGSQFPRSDFQVQVNGVVVADKTQSVGTQGRFLISGAPLGLKVEEGDQISFALQTATQEPVTLFATVFLVPSGCMFERRELP